MIAIITGELLQKNKDEVIVSCGGVGYQIFTSLTSLEKLPELGVNVTLYIYTHVREDALSLYGFLSRHEKDIFIKLLKVNGIGPKLALAILSGVSTNDFVVAVANEDLARLSSIPGIGKKTAERIVLDMKDKLMKDPAVSITLGASTPSIYNDALSALMNLGYQRQSAERALQKTCGKDDDNIGKIIRSALKELSNI